MNKEIASEILFQRRKIMPFMLWVDGAGGFLVCTQPTVVIGQAVPQSGIDIPVLGDLSRRHVRIERVQDRYLLTPLAATTVNKRPVQDATLLEPSQRIAMGQVSETGRVELEFTQPMPLSTSARLDFVSRHRTQPWSDGILLMSDLLTVGPHPRNHIRCTGFDIELALFYRADQLFCRCQEKFELNGKVLSGEQPVDMSSRVCGENFSLSFEPVCF